MSTTIKAIVLSISTLICMADTTAVAQTQWALDTVISAGTNPSGIAITSDGSKLVVTNNANPGAVKIISTSNYAIYTVDISSVENYPNGVTIAPNDVTALVNTTHNTIYIDLIGHSMTGHFAAPCVGTTLYGIAVTPNGQNAVLPDLSSGCTQQGVRSIDATGGSSGSSFVQVSSSGELFGIAITPDGTSAIVTTFIFDSPKKIDLSTSGIQNITGFNGSYGVATLHHSNEALIEGDSLKRVSLTSNTATKTVSDIYSTQLQGIAITADDNYAFVVGSFEKVIVALANNSVLQTFSSGGTSVATMPDGSRFFVTDSHNEGVWVYKKVGTTGVRDVVRAIPTAIALSQNYPNPFNPSTTIRYSLPGRSNVRIVITNTLGQQVEVLENGEREAGINEVTWHANVASGIYFYRIDAVSLNDPSQRFIEVKKMLLLK